MACELAEMVCKLAETMAAYANVGCVEASSTIRVHYLVLISNLCRAMSPLQDFQNIGSTFLESRLFVLVSGYRPYFTNIMTVSEI